VVLEEDKPLQPAQNIVPVGRKDAMTDQVTSTLNALSAKIITEELTKLNKLVDVDKQDPEKVATEWLTQQGLLQRCTSSLGRTSTPSTSAGPSSWPP
jgi:osmoprotectant transport system substrate-binding protein